MNTCIFIGRLTRDPEIRSAGDTKVASFALAVDRRIKSKDGVEADFFNITAFGKSADFAQNWLNKGMKIAITARAENHNYTDKNGVKRYEVQFVAEKIEFAESKKAEAAAPSPVAQDTDFISVPDDVEDEEVPWN